MNATSQKLQPKLRQEARRRVVASFSAHWKRIARSRKDIAADRAECFFARTESARLRLARSYYGIDHAREMARLDFAAIESLLEPFLDTAIRQWLEWHGEFGDKEGDDFLDELTTAEYVTISHCWHLERKSYTSLPWPREKFHVDRYPGERAAYDDLYERLLCGFSVGGVLRVFKSTGEPFSPFDRRCGFAGIKGDIADGIRASMDDDPWFINYDARGALTPGFEKEDLDRVLKMTAIDFSRAEVTDLAAFRKATGKRPMP